MASEYSWSVSAIEELTFCRIKNFLSSIESRKEQEEYLERLHIGMQATAIVKALGASLDQKGITMEELIGKAPGEPSDDTEGNIDEWKEQAEKRGLKTRN